jgi:hypothetical protein
MASARTQPQPANQVPERTVRFRLQQPRRNARSVSATHGRVVRQADQLPAATPCIGRFALPQAGHHLRHPQGPRQERRGHLRRRGAGDPAGRLRLPALRRQLLPGRPRRHLRLAEPDPPLQPAHRRHHLRQDPPAQGGRALLRPAQGQRDQLRAAGERQEQGPVREPHPAVPQPTPAAGAGQRQHRGHHPRVIDLSRPSARASAASSSRRPRPARP